MKDDPLHHAGALSRAAKIQGGTLTDFAVTAAREAACRTVEEADILRVALEDQRRIAEGILDPPAPTAALQRAFRNRRDLLVGE